jgi:hypothetical protein
MSCNCNFAVAARSKARNIIITRGWHNRPSGGRSAEWTQLDSTTTSLLAVYRQSVYLGAMPLEVHDRRFFSAKPLRL